MQDQKVWLVTGASKGIGLAIVKQVLAAGGKVIATTRNAPALEQQLVNANGHLLVTATDITSDEDVKKTIEAGIERFGRVDVVVNNAAYVLGGSIEELSDKEFRKTLDVNLFGVVNVLRHVLPYMRAQGAGYIVNISSSAGYVGYAHAGSYSAAKFALVGISEALQKEVAPFGIKVTLLAPGEFRTNLWEPSSIQFAEKRIAVYNLETLADTLHTHSGQQLGDPDKLAKIVLELADHPDPPSHLLVGPDAYSDVVRHRQNEEKNGNNGKQ